MRGNKDVDSCLIGYALGGNGLRDETDSNKRVNLSETIFSRVKLGVQQPGLLFRQHPARILPSKMITMQL